MNVSIRSNAKQAFDDWADYSGLEQEQEQKQKQPIKGSTTAIGRPLLGSQTSKTRQLELFRDAIDIIPTSTDEGRYVSPITEKEIALSPRQQKMIFALAGRVDSIKHRQNVKDYALGLPVKLSIGNNLKNPLRTSVNLRELAKAIYGKQNIGTKQVQEVRKDLMGLSKVWRAVEVKDELSGHVTSCTLPLITLLGEMKVRTEQGKLLRNELAIEISDIFLYDLYTAGGFVTYPSNLLDLWNKYGTNKELYAYLQAYLIYVFGIKTHKAKQDVACKTQELTRAGKEEADIARQVKAIKRKALTASITTNRLLENLFSNPYSYEKGGKEYLRAERLNKDLQETAEALKKIGIISEFYKSTSTAGSELCNFVINPNWIDEQKTRQRALLASGDTDDQTPEEADE